MSHRHATEVATGRRFAFGENWTRFLDTFSEERVLEAEHSLLEMLEMTSMDRLRFLDVGCGSGLFSLAARRLGARVRSFDYDPASVACARKLKCRFFPKDEMWIVQEGSALDRPFLTSLGTFDVVYSWGVLHHTGAMWEAIENVTALADPGGRLYIAIYNDAGRSSRFWRAVKKAYNRLPSAARFLIVGPAFCVLWGPPMIRDLLIGHPLRTWKHYRSGRGMSPWRDVLDWVGGWPYEFAKPEEVFDFHRKRGFTLRRLRTWGGGNGCNEFVFARDQSGIPT